MSKTRAGLIQQVFLAALDVPAENREDWLQSTYAHDQALLTEVRSLLAHVNPSVDLLEQEIDQAVDDMPQLQTVYERAEQSEADTQREVSGEEFLSKLSEVGVLSPDEMSSASDSLNSGNPPADPRQLASQLVSKGKLTPYQASALLKGEPDLLIDKYLILDLIDVGGMGMVFKAIHRTMNRVVALKMISHQALASVEQIKRFRREVQVAATLEHPNIVRAYDADESRGLHFLVMEYVRGDNLNRVVQADGPLSLTRAVDYIRQAAVALDYAHNRGVVHRDIKPGNLLLDDHGTVKVLDLGLAHIDDSLRHGSSANESGEDESKNSSIQRSDLTEAGSILGTASFMAPEQSLDAHLVDRRSDIYSLGCTLYFLMTGDTPFRGNTIFKVFVEHREAAIPSLQDKRADVPDSLDAVYRKMLAKQPEDRYQSIQELLVALDDCRIAAPKSPTTKSHRTTSPATKEGKTTPATFAWNQPTPWRLLTATGLATMALAVIVALVLFNGNALEKTPDSLSISPPSQTPPTSTENFVTTTPLMENLGPAINTNEFELGGDMSEDGLILVYCSTRNGTPRGNRDLWIASRPSIEEEWSTVERLPATINTEEHEQIPNISDDGLTLRFWRGADWMVSTRADRETSWSEAVADPDAVGLRAQHKQTGDRRTAFRPGKLEPDHENGPGVSLMTWERPSPEDPFGEMQKHFISTNKPIGGYGTLSNDGLTFMYGQDISIGSEKAGHRIFITTRPNKRSDWSTPVLLFPENGSSYGTPQFVRDEKSFLAVSNRNDGYGAGDLWLGKLPDKRLSSTP